MKYVLLLISSFVVFGCKTSQDISKLTSDDVKIEMTRGACYGKCPIYTIKVYEGGYTTLAATRFTRMLGKFSKKISKKEYEELVTAFERANLYQYPDLFESEAVDLPLISLIYNGFNGKKTVRGRDERPMELIKLQSMIENIYNKDDWTLVEAPTVMEKAPLDVVKETKILKDRIIIKPKDGERLPLFFKDMEQYGVRLITRVSDEQNLWLITYKTNDIDSNKMLRLIKEHPSIESAEFDKELESRDR